MIPPLPFCHGTLKASIRLDPAYLQAIRTLEDNIRKRRLDLKMTADELAIMVRVDIDTVFGWEYDKFEPATNGLTQIIVFLGLRLQKLLY